MIVTMDVSPRQYEGIKEIELDFSVDELNKRVTVFVERYFYEMAKEDCISLATRMYPDYEVTVKYP